LNGNFPPQWFFEKFQNTFLNIIPYGLNLSFLIIVLLEIAIPIAFLVALVSQEFRSDSRQRFSSLGFRLSLVLFLVLFFGSFLVQDYENGFLDFMYFVATIYLMRFTANKSSQ
jgi:predicted tellurium resistance membrane protein TerC